MRVEQHPKDAGLDWDDFVLRSGGGTFFHLAGWKNVIERTFGFKAHYLVAKEGEGIKGILPLFRVPHLPFGAGLISVPYAAYGGICSDDGQATKALLDSAVEVLKETGARYLELRNIGGLDTPGLSGKDLYATFRRPILSSAEANMAAIPRKERAEIRKGINNGLSTRWGGMEVLDDFYNVYAQSVRNLGTPVFPKSLFRNLLEEFGERCRILTVVGGGNVLAGVMTFFHKDDVMPYYGGAIKESYSASVNDYMYWNLMLHGLEHGYKVFDFGRSKKGTGAYRFKEHWGFVAEPLQYQYFLPKGAVMPNISPANPKFKLAISLWKRLPLPITKMIGPPLTRYLS